MLLSTFVDKLKAEEKIIHKLMCEDADSNQGMVDPYYTELLKRIRTLITDIEYFKRVLKHC